jgi:hypothetical protein
MADTVNIRWVYPPNYDRAPNPPDNNGWKRVVIQMTGLSDGTGETAVTKLNISELRTTSGSVPTRTAVERIEYNIYGKTVKLEWDRAPKELISLLNGAGGPSQGVLDWKKQGGLVDPGKAGDGTGDILLTTTDATSGDSYDITMTVRLKE